MPFVEISVKDEIERNRRESKSFRKKWDKHKKKIEKKLEKERRKNYKTFDKMFNDDNVLSEAERERINSQVEFAGKIIEARENKSTSELSEFLEEQLQNGKFNREWNNTQPELTIMKVIIDTMVSQNLTEKQLAKRTGIKKSVIKRLEEGTENPSLKLLKRLANGMDMDLRIEFISRDKAQRA